MSEMNIQEIAEYLPHRYPMLLVDRVLECVPGEYLVALKNVTANEPFFPGHFPERPVMPGVMILEVMGRDAGHIALTAGIAGGADVILIPEISYTIENVAKKIQAVKEGGRNFALIIVSEAIRTPDGQKHEVVYHGGERFAYRRDHSSRPFSVSVLVAYKMPFD